MYRKAAGGFLGPGSPVGRFSAPFGRGLPLAADDDAVEDEP